ncbi:PPC domain-containing protein, partial [Limnospira sp. PMC 1042.18]|uniref:PPC domain-containing protein n=1 Tax=Limnospira sp. PMC 1042.18 TaxID=2981018 RepID=UPI0028E0D45A
ISLAGLGAGTYYVHVYGWNDASNPNYSLTIDPRVVSGNGSEDRFAGNHSFDTAYNLGPVNSPRVEDDLVIVSGNDDWFSFTTNGNAGSGAEVRIDFLHSLGDVDMRLYDADNNWLGSSTSVSDNESISLAGLGAGTYYVHVYGWNDASNPNYSLTIDPRVVSGNG